MKHEKKQAILVVSFGTSHEDTRRVTIEAIEQEIRDAYPEMAVYRAWTSRMIVKKLRERDGLIIHNVAQAMEQMRADGITQVIVQPTHVINGYENEAMKREVEENSAGFEKISFGDPLLTSEQDIQKAVKAVMQEFSQLRSREALVLMGHGTEHESDAVYTVLEREFRKNGYANVFVGTVEGYPSVDELLEKVKAAKPEKVYLAPFMIVAGDHAKNDMAGENEESWVNRFRRAGMEPVPILKGLGEYPGIRQIFAEHCEQCLKPLK
jgi:cobalamin biosynthesis Co2+ chelatase CbiK